MTKIVSSFIIIAFLCVNSVAKSNIGENPEKNDISNTIKRLFEGMKKGDSSMVHQAFDDNVIMQTVFITKQGETKLHRQKLQRFLDAVGTPHEGVWNEKITSETVQIDGIMAHVWTDYLFYVDDKFIHCGVNSFQLAKLNGKWKIVSIIDTRRTKGCLEK